MGLQYTAYHAQIFEKCAFPKLSQFLFSGQFFQVNILYASCLLFSVGSQLSKALCVCFIALILLLPRSQVLSSPLSDSRVMKKSEQC